MNDKRRRQTESPAPAACAKKTKINGRASSWAPESPTKGLATYGTRQRTEEATVVESGHGFKPLPIAPAQHEAPAEDDFMILAPPFQTESSSPIRQLSGTRASPAEEPSAFNNSLVDEGPGPLGIAVRDKCTAQRPPFHPEPSLHVDSDILCSPPLSNAQSPAKEVAQEDGPKVTTRAQTGRSPLRSEDTGLWKITLSGDVASGAADIKLTGIPPDTEAAVMILINALCGIMDKSGANDAKPEPSSTFKRPKTPRAPIANMSKPTTVMETPDTGFTAINSRPKPSTKSRRTTLIDTPVTSSRSPATAIATPSTTSTATRMPNTTYGNYTHAEVKAEIDRAASAFGETTPTKNRRDEIKAMYLLGQFELFDRTGDVYERVTKCSECVKRGKNSCFVVNEERETVIVTQRCAWCLHDRKKCED